MRQSIGRVEESCCTTSQTYRLCVYIHGLLLAIGGEDTNGEPTSAVHMYNPRSDSWKVISHMGTQRRECIAAVLPNNQLMVVGGETERGGLEFTTDSTELATIELL